MKKNSRNSLCKCGSGKKYKYCCAASYEVRGARRNVRRQGVKQSEKEPVERIESFLGYLWDKRLWTLTWGGFLYCLYFVISFYLSFPIEVAKIEMYEERARFYKSDFERAKAIIEKTEQSLASFGKPLKLGLISMLDAGTDEDNFKSNQSALESISDLRRDISYSLGEIQSGAFQSTAFVDFFKGYEDDLTNLDRYLVYFQKSLTTVGIRNKEGEYFEYVNNSSKLIESYQSLSERNAGSLERLSAIASEAELERNEQHGKSTLLRLKLVFVFLGLVYIALFPLLTIWRWHKFNRKKSSKLANTLEGFLESAERFADYTNNRKLWGVSSLLFSGCFLFVLSTINSVPEDIARIERFNAHIKLTIKDGMRLTLFWENFESLYARQSEVTERLSETLKIFQTDPRIMRDRFSGDIIAFVSLRGEISKQLGMIRGMNIQSPAFANHFGQVEENLKQYDEVVTSFEKIHHGFVEGTVTEKEVLEVANNPKNNVATLALRESVSSTHVKLLSALNVLDIEEREYKGHKKALIVRVIALIPSTFYMLAFSLEAISSGIKFRHRTRSQKL
jgi:hypothetical protein